MTSCKPVSFSRRTLHHGVSKYVFIFQLSYIQMSGENCSLLGRNAANSGNSLPTFRDNLSVPNFLPLKMGPILRFGTTYRSHSQGSRINSRTVRMGPTGRPETLLRNYHYLPRNGPEDRSFQMLRGGSLKLLKYWALYIYMYVVKEC